MFAIEERFKLLEQQVELACNASDEEVAANLRRFGTVLICGFVERSIEVILLERLKPLAHPKVLNFVKSHFKRGTNYNCEVICNLLERFDQLFSVLEFDALDDLGEAVNRREWKNKFKHFMDNNEKEVDALSSTYSVRNSVAHGGSGGINAITLRERRDDVKKIVDALIKATTG